MQHTRLVRFTFLLVIFGVVQFFLLTSFAAFFYPGGYDYFGYYFSDLGALVAKNGEPNTVSSMLFSVALVIIALSLIPFWLKLRSIFTESRIEKSLSTLGSIFGLFSSPFIIGVALFPIDTQLDIHFIVTMMFFSLFVASTLLYSVVIFLNANCSNYFGLFGIILFIISLIIFIDPLAQHVALLQTIVTYGYFIWVLLQSTLFWNWKE